MSVIKGLRIQSIHLIVEQYGGQERGDIVEQYGGQERGDIFVNEIMNLSFEIINISFEITNISFEITKFLFEITNFFPKLQTEC